MCAAPLLARSVGKLGSGASPKSASASWTRWSSTSPSSANPVVASPPVVEKRNRPTVSVLTAALVGTLYINEFDPTTRAVDEKICSPGSFQSPSALKSIHASSTPSTEAVTSTEATVAGITGEVKMTPSSSSLPSLSSPMAAGPGWPPASPSTEAPRWMPETIVCRAPLDASNVG